MTITMGNVEPLHKEIAELKAQLAEIKKAWEWTEFSERLPTRDEFRGEQTLLIYNENTGSFDLDFYESGWEFSTPYKIFGNTHWIDISRCHPLSKAIGEIE